MIKKITLVLAAAGVLGCGSSIFAQTTSDDATLQQQIKALQAQITALETKVDEQESANAKKASASSKETGNKFTVPTVAAAPHATQLVPANNVLVANYIGVAPQYDGSNLIINNPGVNNDVALLKLRKAELEAYKAAGNPYEGTPELIFSGEVEGTSVYKTPYNSTPAGTDFDLTDAEIDAFIEGNSWVSGFMTFIYNSGSDGEANAVNNSGLQLGQGFITIGNLAETPFYGSFGQMYVPFGRFSSYMVSTPSAKTLGRIQTRAINLGYYSPDKEITPFAAVYGYRGSNEIDGNQASNTDVEDYGVNAGISFSKGDYAGSFGASYTSNIASSGGLQGDGSSGSGFSQSSASEKLAHRVPGIDVNGSISYKDYTLLAEFVKATKEFNQNDLSYNGHGAQPKALDIEAAYSFIFWRPSYVAVAYGQSWQALSIGVPAKNYGIVYSTAIWRNTALSFEVMHNIGYSGKDTAYLDGQPTTNNASQGENYNTVSLRFDLFF